MVLRRRDPPPNMASTNMPPSTLSHERDIPSIITTLNPRTTSTTTLLTHALATSLAAAKRLTWTQTPWLSPPLSPSNIPHIHTMLQHHKPNLSPSALEHALFLGELRFPEEEADSRPSLYVVFPHLQRKMWEDATLMRTWHDDIVAPAFNRAWEDSGLVQVSWEFHHSMIAVSGDKVVRHLESRKMVPLAQDWPAYEDRSGSDTKNGGGAEGKFAVVRERLYGEAWEAMCGMVRGHPGLGELRDMFLVIVGQGEKDVLVDLNAVGKVRAGVEAWKWDFCVDSRFVVRGSFGVVCRDVVGHGVMGVNDRVDIYEKGAVDLGYVDEEEVGDEDDMDDEEWFKERFKGVTIVNRPS